MSHENSWPFRQPVDVDKVRDYYEVITKPMDLETITRKVKNGLRAPGTEPNPELEQYSGMEEFKGDIKQIFDNARTYNQKETIYYKYAQQLEALIKPMLNRLRDNTTPCSVSMQPAHISTTNQ